jgi:hypothetical protein
MNKARIQIAKPDIIRYFDELPQTVYLAKELSRHLSEQRQFWRLAQNTTTATFVEFLIKSGKLSKTAFPFPKPYKPCTRFSWGDVTLYEVMLSLKPGCYFTQYTAVKFHHLTEQIPKTVYLNDEQPNDSVSTGVMTQQSMDNAFRRQPRVSKYLADVGDFRVCMLNGKNTGKLGVVEENVIGDSGQALGRLRFTNLERTLIDIVVRPFYAGGVFEVAKAFHLAMDKLSVNSLAAMLQKLRYIYPYHQAAGYYLERAGYKPSQLDLLRRFPMEFDFYLAHDMGATEYVKDWRLYIPKGF